MSGRTVTQPLHLRGGRSVTPARMPPGGCWVRCIDLLLPRVIGAVGVVWIGHALGLLAGRSFMVDDVRWAIAGLVVVVAGIGHG